MTDAKASNRPTITASRRSARYRGGSITIENLSDEEVDRLEAAITLGAAWVRGGDALEFADGLKPAPGPASDPLMMPFWREAMTPHDGRLLQRAMPGIEHTPFSPSVYISHLCGYHYTEERYRQQAQLLESYGFTCLRSRRGNDGRFLELWYLPGLWCAEGDLEVAIRGLDQDKQKIEKAVSFLCQNASFGSLDIVAQRAAMVID